MNRRGFLKGAIKAVGLAAIGSSILPSVVKADSPSPTIDISEIDGSEGGYIEPGSEEYMSDLIRRDMSEAFAVNIDKAILGGDRYIQPIISNTSKVALKTFNSLNG